MAAKAPKKKESKDHIATPKDAAGGAPLAANHNQIKPIGEDQPSAKRKPSIPVWLEWSDQDIANEKWDTGRKEKDRGRSPTAMVHYFDDPEGRIDLPYSLKARVKSWKRPTELFDEKIPMIVDPDYIGETDVDLLSPNEHITDSELIRTIIASLTSLYEIFSLPLEAEMVSSIVKMKSSLSKDQKDSKIEKNKREVEVIEETAWKCWDQIWPKESGKGNSLPFCNPAGKYAVKLFWMGSFRKVVVDDTIPVDENQKPLLPLTTRGNELWPLILSKALIKVASLDYFGGQDNSEIGDVNIIHCLTGWLPEPIPLNNGYSDEVWKLLLKFLPNWKLPQPNPPQEDVNLELKGSVPIEETTISKQEVSAKESKESKEPKDSKNKKDNKDEKKQKGNEKIEREVKINKEKITSVSYLNKQEQLTPEYVVLASFSNPPGRPYKISELKEMADSSEKLRQFGLSHNLPHPVHVTVVRNCSLIAPPIPIPIPRWKLIRQKKKKEITGPPISLVERKEPKFLEIKSPFFNFKVGPTPLSSSMSPNKWENFKPAMPMTSVCEEDFKDEEEKVSAVDSSLTSTELKLANSGSIESETLLTTKRRSLSNPSQISDSRRSSLSKSSKSRTRSSKDAKKLSLEDSKSNEEDIDVAVNIEETDTSSKICAVEEHEAEIKEPKDLWMDFDDFCQCFSTLWIYHKPKSYNKNISEVKVFDSKSNKAKKTSGRNTVLSPTSAGSSSSAPNDILSPYLFIDCLKITELVISFASFSRWFDPNLNISCEKTDYETLIKQALTPVSGTLVVEPYSWKAIVTSSPILCLCTTGVKAAVITLPPGRHVLRLMIYTPLGYHINICSSHYFIFGDEHSVMQHLTKESSRFIDHGVNVLKSLGTVIQAFSNTSIPRECNFLIGTEDRLNVVRREHFESLYKSLFKILKLELGEVFTPSMTFALEALKYESKFYTKKMRKEVVKRRPFSDMCNSPKIHVDMKQRLSVPFVEGMHNITVEDTAATKIQACFKRFFAMKLRKAHTPGTAENTLVVELLNRIWNHIELNMESIAIQVYRSMFHEKPSLFTFFPFYVDEWNKVTYFDYTGSYPEQPAESWFIICREVFFVQENVLFLPKFYSNISGCNLKVIDNDTRKEIRTVFMKVVPQILKKNKLGYTFIVTAQSETNIIPGGKFRLRLISDTAPLPCPVKEGSVNTHFVSHDVRDYYIPNRYKRIFRYCVKVSEDILSSIQFSTSKDDIYVKLQVLDGENEIYSCEGKGYLVVPALLFYKDRLSSTDEAKKTSRSTSRSGSARSSAKVTTGKRPVSSRRSTSPEKGKKKISTEFKHLEAECEEEQIHKYIVQGYVLRDSWPLTKKQWNFVETLKNQEEEEEVPPDVKPEVNKNSAGKSRKGNAGKDSKGNRSRPESQTQNAFDTTKAYWSMRFVVDSNFESAVEIKRDTEREDEVKALKSAWESTEPGRAAKAQQCRLKYLEAHTTKVVEDKEDTVEEESHEEQEDKKQENDEIITETVQSPVSPLPSEPDTGELFIEAPVKESDTVMKIFNFAPYIRSTGKKILLDETEEERIRKNKENKFEAFQAMREMVLALREDDRISRNNEKERQISEYEAMQIKLDSSREELYKTREAYRNKFIQQPEVETTELEAEKKKRTPSPKRKGSKAVKSPTKVKKK